MEDRYKLTIEGRNLYREAELGPDLDELSVGTAPTSGVRLRRDLFFAPIELKLRKAAGEWSLFCPDHLYLSVGDVRRLLVKKLAHGDEIQVRYRDSDQEVFTLSFRLDFDYGRKDYNLEIDLSGKDQLRIGGAEGSDLFLESPYLGRDFLLLKREGGKIRLYDKGSRCGVYVNGVRIRETGELKEHDFFSCADFSFYYRNGRLYAADSAGMRLNGLEARRIDRCSSPFSYPWFNRGTRIRYAIPQIRLEIQQAAPPPAKPRKNIVLAVLPSLVMLALTIVLRGLMGGGGVFVVYSAASMGLGAAMSAAAFVMENREYKRETEKRIDAYKRYMEEKRREIEGARADELRIRRQMHPALEDSLREAQTFGSRLFERSPEDEDFLQVYLGKGRVESANPIGCSRQEFIDGEDPLAVLPQQTAESFRYLENAPVAVDLRPACTVGVAGPAEALREMFQNMVLDIAIRNFYREVKMVFILREEDCPPFRWLRWLPHGQSEELGLRYIVCDEESRGVILEEVYGILSARETAAGEKTDFGEWYLVFVTDLAAIRTHPLFRHVKKAADYGFTFVFFSQWEALLPQGCTQIIRLGEEGKGRVIPAENGDLGIDFFYPLIPDRAANLAAHRLGGIRAEEVSPEGELPSQITMFEMLDILSTEDIDLGSRWEKAESWRSLAAPIGVRAKNQLVYLDIGDKPGAHGPHGLVAGTTGSGKSEVLQTYILSMAVLFHPHQVRFVLIDFKGGGMANQFRRLPHLAGTITNIDGREIKRSLLSIKAELRKRQEIFAESGVNHIDDYSRLYKKGRVSVPLPHLILIVDEFAQLKQEYPDFMKELIAAARIGRTLGIHLILSTQKPAGVVDAQIWSNSRFRLCLKVQSKEDSSEMLKNPLASEITEPGRAYFQVGSNEVFTLFQSAYSGAAVPEGNEEREREYAIWERNFWGKRTLTYTSKKAGAAEGTGSQLQAIVDHIAAYCRRQEMELLPAICLPPLEDWISTVSLTGWNRKGREIAVPIGIYDDPERQRQGIVRLDVSRDNILIVGSAQTGKSVLLQTLAYELIRLYGPQEVSLYLVDCGSLTLRLFEASAHVGGVVLASEEEKGRNLFKLLDEEVIRRKKLLADRGVGTFAAYLEAGYGDLPLLLVLIDNVAAFKEYFPRQADELGRLSREAQGVGLSFVVTAASASVLPYRTQANFGCRLAFRCNDAGEYGSLFGRCKIAPGENAGRGLVMQGKDVLEFQAAIFGEGEREADRNRELCRFIERRNGECSGQAVKIPMIPGQLSLEKMLEEEGAAFRDCGVLPIGMDFDTVDLTSIRLGCDGFLALFGDEARRDRFTENLLRMLGETAVFHSLRVWIADDRAGKLRPFSRRGFAEEYTADDEEGLLLAVSFCEDVLREKEDGGYRMLILAGEEVFQKICADRERSRRFAQALQRAAQEQSFFLLAVPNQAVNWNSSEALRTIKEERSGIFFGDLADCRLFEIPGRVKAALSFDGTTGYRFRRDGCSKIKLFE